MESDIARIVQAARKVHQALGPGFVESIYARALIAELGVNGFRIEREKPIKIFYGCQVVGRHRLDLLINCAVIVELKANRGIIPVHRDQVRSYLRPTRLA